MHLTSMPCGLSRCVVAWSLSILVWFLAAAGCVCAGDSPVIRFLPQWEPQAQFAGYYVAFEKGFYASNDLTVDLMRGGPQQPVSRFLQEGRADVGTLFLSTAIERRINDKVPVVNIGQIVQRSALLLVARKSSGIRTPADLRGRKVGVWPEFQAQPVALFRKYDVRPRLIPQSDTLNLFLRGGVDAASAMWYNEYHLLLNAGLDPEDLTVFFYDRFDLNFPEDGLYCLADTVRSRPEPCRRFVNASLAGWRYAFDHPDEALEIVMKYVTAANRPTNRTHQKWMLEHMRDLVLPPDRTDALGELSREDFLRVTRELKSCGVVNRIPTWEDFYVPVIDHR